MYFQILFFGSLLSSLVHCHLGSLNESHIPTYKASLQKRARIATVVEVNGIKYMSCTQQQIATLSMVATNVHAITRQMSNDFNKKNRYVQAFWPQDSMTDEWMKYGKQFFSRMGSKLRIGSKNPDKLVFDCDPGPNLCTPGVPAFTIAETNTMGFCSIFFSDSRSITTIPCQSGKPLEEYNSWERAITHELTHTQLAPKDRDGRYFSFPKFEGPALDIKASYGVEKAKALAAGKIPGQAPDMARRNADNWALMAIGNWVGAQCNKDGKFVLPIEKRDVRE